MSLAIPVIRVRCHICSRFRRPSEILHLPGGALRCLQCQERHEKALLMLAGNAPFFCQECGKSPEQLMAESGASNTQMCIQWKDGVYQVLCVPCSDAYERKRLDLYGDTVHGFLKKLKGAK